MPPAQFGMVSYVLVVFLFVAFIVDSILGSPITYEEHRSGTTLKLRRGTLIVATLSTILAAYSLIVPLVLVLSPSIGTAVESLGGAHIVLLAIASYCLALFAFEQLRRTSYANDQPARLLVASGLRFAGIGCAAFAVRAGWVSLGFGDTFTIATVLLLAAAGMLLWRMISSGQLVWRPRGITSQRIYLTRIFKVYAANAGSLMAFASLELLLLSGMIWHGDAEAVGRFRGLQIAILVVNLLVVATENANAGRHMVAASVAGQRFWKSVYFLMAGGSVLVVGFLLVGQPIVAFLLGPGLVPTSFEIGCGAILLFVNIVRAPFAILLRFSRQFNFVFWVYVGSAVLEFVVLALLFSAGLRAWVLAALVLAHVASSIAIGCKGFPLLPKT